MIKRIGPNDPLKVPVKDIKSKTLSRVQVVDPTLSPAEMIAYQSKLQEHTNNYIEKALKKALVHIERESTKAINEEERELDRLQVEEEDAHFAKALEAHRFGDSGKFREKMQEMFPDFAQSLQYDTSTRTATRPTIASDPLQHVKEAPDTKSLIPHLADPDVKVRTVATQRYKELQRKKE